MAGGIEWFRWHHGSVTDPKFQLVARRSGARLSDVLAVWAYLLEEASTADVRGDFGDVDVESIDCLFDFDDGTTNNILDAMVARGLVDGTSVAAWEKRQPKRERDDPSAAERQRAKRARDAEADHVTPCHATSHQQKPREEKSREEKNSPSLRSGEVRASRLPTDWVLPDDWRQWARAERSDLDLDRAAASFADYWHGKAGKDGRKADWAATWRNWVRNERSILPSRASPTTASFRERDAAAASERYRRLTGQDSPVVTEIRTMKAIAQ